MRFFEVNLVKRIFVTAGLVCLSLFFLSCFGSHNPSPDPDPEPDPEPNPTEETLLKIENNTQYAVNVYINAPPLYDDTSIQNLRQVPANDSQEWPLLPTPDGERTTLYFEYLIPIGETIIPYYTSNTANVKAIVIEEGETNTQEVPVLGNAQTDSIFVLIKNNSRYDRFWVLQGAFPKYPFSGGNDILPGQDALFVFDGNSTTSLSGFTIGDNTRWNFLDTVLEKGKVYSFMFDGKSEPGLFLVEPFDPEMAKNVWSIPTDTAVNRSLTVGFFAPRDNPSDGYLVLGNINIGNEYASGSFYKTIPYFATIAQKGNIIDERIIPFPTPNPNQSLFKCFIEDANEYVFFGQRRHEGESKPFIMGITPGGFVINYYYTGFTGSIDETHQSLDSYGLVKVGNRQYGISCNVYDKNTGSFSILIANITTTWNSAFHNEWWRSPEGLDINVVDMIYDPDHNTYIVLAEEYQHTVSVQRTIIYFVDVEQSQQEKFNPIVSDSHIFFRKIVKIDTDYYVLGYYDNPVGRGEGLLQKLDPTTGNIAWSTPERFTPKDTMNHLAVSNLILDNGRLILAGYTNATDVQGSNGNPWICAFDPVERKKIWETEYDEYIDYTVNSIYANGIGSYILELYNKYDRDSLLISTDLMGRPAIQKSDPLPRRTDLNYTLQEVANPSQFSAEIVPMLDVEITPPVLQIPKGQTGTFTVTGTYTIYEWYLDGDLTTSGSGTYILQTNLLSRGIHTVTAVVTSSIGERRSGSYTVMVTN